MVFFHLFSRAATVAYEGCQVRGQIGATAAAYATATATRGSEPHLQPTPQLMATPDP